MRDVSIIGVGMTRFGKFEDRTTKDLGREAFWSAVEDANISPRDIEVAYVANAVGQQLTELKGTTGQHVLTSAGVFGIPIINVENACSGGTTSLRGAYMEVASGSCDIALAMGVEKLFCGDSAKSAQTMASGTIYAKYGFIFVAQYAMELKKWMEKSGATKEHFAKVTVKNTYNGSMNPKAQFQKAMTMAQVLNSRVIAEPLTQFMCSTMADGAAAAILCSRDIAHRFTSKPLIDIAACELVSGTFPFSEESHEKIATRAAKRAYEKAGIGPEDVDVVEVHDAMAPAELRIYEELNLCKPGEAVKLIDEGITTLAGRLPVNPSGGLAAKGHPISATGLAQIYEIVLQLRGEAGPRQVTNDPKIGMTENAGGWVMSDNAACAVTILKK
ncbi:MAG: thiolase family protein [Deltaproteobacteria bacterium]|nr:thiolase family protein [Deltaproteobacteria bacterium]